MSTATATMDNPGCPGCGSVTGPVPGHGRARRCHSESQRLEISTRHSSCVVGGCTVPIRDCEIHHDVAWDIGGETDVLKGVPVCRRKHHPQVSEGGYRLERAADGGFDLVASPGADFRAQYIAEKRGPPD